MFDPGAAREGAAGRAGPNSDTRSSKSAFSQITGVFAGTARGARLGGVVGSCACFFFMMVYLAYDAMREPGGNRTAAEYFYAFLFGAAWFGVMSLLLGGICGAILGALVGTFLPIRRWSSGEQESLSAAGTESQSRPTL